MIRNSKKTTTLEISLAGRGVRTLAFIMDIILISLFSMMIISTVVIPKYDEDAFKELTTIIDEYSGNRETIQNELTEKLSPEVKSMMEAVQTTIIICFWLYFFLTESFMRGSTIGKKMFSIRTISMNTMDSPGIFEGILRSGIKTITMFALFPIMLINFLIAFVTKQSQTGHDFIMKTLVVNSRIVAIEEDTKREK